MGVIAAAARELIAAGLSGDDLCAALDRIESQHKTIDDQAERRRAADRARKRLRNSAESAECAPETKGFPPNPLSKNSNPSNPPSPPTGAQTPTPKSRGCSIPESWQAKPKHFEDAQAKGFDAEFVETQAGAMREWAMANRNRQVARKADWDLTFSGWLRREIGKAHGRGPPKPADPRMTVIPEAVLMARYQQ